MSAFSLGSVRGLLGLDETNFVRGMLNSEASTEFLGRGIVNFVNNPLLASISIFKQFAVGAAEVVKETAFANQEFARMAERTGAGIRTLTGLRVAFKDFNLTNQDLEKTFSELAKRIEETKTSEDARKRFDRLNVTVRDTDGNLRSIDDILRDVSDGLAGMEDRTERMAIAQQLFGDKGVQLLSILGKGSAAIDDFRAKAERFGLVLTENAAKQSDRFAGSLGDLQFSIDGVKEAMATGFIEGYTVKMTDAQLATDNFANTINQNLVPVAREVGGVLAEVAKNLDLILKAYNLLKRSLPSEIILRHGIFPAVRAGLDLVGGDDDADVQAVAQSQARRLAAQRQSRALE